jgi:hypothetical protein
MNLMSAFSGSYKPEDITFLLSVLQMQPIGDLVTKEALIQSGQRHYSEIIGVEYEPPAAYIDLFQQMVRTQAERVGRDLIRLCAAIRAARGGAITLVSFARAGSPIGVLVKRLLKLRFATEAKHYSISIIRERGIDFHALAWICQNHEPDSIVFIDGWTSKGSIAKELVQSLRSVRIRGIPEELYVLADISGTATAAGSYRDYLIPSCMLNATVSGLVSRTILNEMVGPSDFHGCLYYTDMIAKDLSRWFVDEILGSAFSVDGSPDLAPVDRVILNEMMVRLVERLKELYAVNDERLIKPGICEATRALLRRNPSMLILRDPDSPDVQHLVNLAGWLDVSVSVWSECPIEAVAIIRRHPRA